MKKLRKILSVFLSLVMAVSVLAGTGVQVQAASSKQVVYFNNSVSDWSNVYAYVWGSGLTTKAIKGTKVADDVYKMEIPAEYSKILFKNTSGTSNWDKKTANTTIPTDGKNCFKPKSSSNKSSGTWSTYTAVTATPKVTATTKAKESDETITFYYDNSKTSWSSVHAYVWGGATTTTVKGTSVGSNVYSFTISSSYKNVLFKNTSGTSSWDKQTADAGAPQTGKIFVPSSSSNKTGGSWKGYTATATPTVAPVDYMSFSYDNTKTKWSNVYVYAWVEGDASVTPVIEKSIACIDNEVYYFKVPTTYKNILFKNVESTSSWDQQTADTVMPTDYCQRFFTYSGANKTDGYWKEVLPVTTTPPAPVTTPPVTTPPVTTPPAPVTTPPVNTVTFYYDNSKTNWSNVHAYVWGGDTTTTVQGTKVEDNVYSFTVSSNYQNVLFKNTSGTSSWDRQTADAGKPQAGKIFTPSSSSNKTGGSWNSYVTQTPTPVREITLSFNNSKTNWSNVYAYVWVEGDSSVTPVVLPKTSVSGSTYTFKVASTYKNILFKNTSGTSNWDQQTADTNVPTGDGYTFITYSGTNKTDGYWKEPQTSNVKRRALVLGETSTNAVPILDVTSMVKMFENFTFDGKSMDEIVQYNDHTIAEITSKIQTVFADTTDEDISYIYMTCHGGSNGSIAIGSNGSYSGASLRKILDQYVKGEVVLMIDCCYAGAAIGKENENASLSTEFANEFIQDFINGEQASKIGELASERFHVLCASNQSEYSYGGSNGGVATRYWEQGCGWLEVASTRTSLLADANGDSKVTVDELYNYAYPLAVSYQHMVVYPENDNLVFGGRY